MKTCADKGMFQLGQEKCYTCATKPVCGCSEEYNKITNKCDKCPAGQLSGNTAKK